MFKTARVLGPALALLGAGTARAQATWDTADIPQPHLQAARALSAQENGWRHPMLVTCYPFDGQPSQNVNKNPPGTRVFDNLYYVGNGKNGTYVVDTSAGLILIDAMNSARDVTDILLPAMRDAGLDPARLKVLILSHGHRDHYGGARYVQDTFKVRTYLSGPDWDMIERDSRQPDARPVPRRDIEVKDGDTIRLGDMAIKTYLSPGHTAASLTMFIPVKDHGRAKTLLYLGGVTNREIGAEMHEAFDRSSERLLGLLASTRVDGMISAHPNYDDAIYKIEMMSAFPQNPSPFLAPPEEVALGVRIMKECNLNNAMLERVRPRGRGTRVPSVRVPSLEARTSKD